MKEQTIEASKVKRDDLVYYGDYFAPDKWVRVKSVEVVTDDTPLDGLVKIDIGYVKLYRHQKEGIAVKRSRLHRNHSHDSHTLGESYLKKCASLTLYQYCFTCKREFKRIYPRSKV